MASCVSTNYSDFGSCPWSNSLRGCAIPNLLYAETFRAGRSFYDNSDFVGSQTASYYWASLCIAHWYCLFVEFLVFCYIYICRNWWSFFAFLIAKWFVGKGRLLIHLSYYSGYTVSYSVYISPCNIESFVRELCRF